MKKIYFQPEVQVAQIALQTIVLAGSGDPALVDPTLNLNPGVSTDEVW